VDQEPERRRSLRKGPHEVASLLRDPYSTRVLGAAGQVYPPTAELDEEEDVEPPQADRVHREEVAREHALSLAAEELTPAESSALASRAKARVAQ